MPWADPCVPSGCDTLPEAGDIVWVEFEEGNLLRPVWIGTLYGKGVSQD